MKEYESSSELEGKTLLLGDKIILKGLVYEVRGHYLNCEGHCNDRIFDELSLEKYSFCTEHYGYITDGGDWPIFNENDYKAATRVVMALFRIIEGKDVKTEEEEFKPKTYRSLAELEGNTLKKGDSLYFGGFQYEVTTCYLKGVGCVNDAIFSHLKIEDKRDFCTECYGYSANDCIFPECSQGDYEALTRVAKELFKRCESKLEEPVNPESSDPVCYTSYASLSGNTLKGGDRVKFGDVCLYRVELSYLEAFSPSLITNDYIFDYLAIDKEEWASKHYGYDLRAGVWPSFEEEDYEAATRLVLALFKEFERQEELKAKKTSESAKDSESGVCTYRSAKELRGKVLKEGDIVYLLGDRHRVDTNFLFNYDGVNGRIFQRLSLDPIAFATIFYGYPAKDMGSNYWPECQLRDYEALTRLVLALFGEIDRQGKTPESTDKLVDELNADLDDLLDNPIADTISTDKSEFTFTHVKPLKIKF